MDARSDLFSFGALFHEMLTGDARPSTARAKQAFAPRSSRAMPPAVSTLQPAVPRAIDDIVRRCLSKDPAQSLSNGRAISCATLQGVAESMQQLQSATASKWRWPGRNSS